MSKQQFWTLNIVGGACALMIVGNVLLGQLDLRLNREVVDTQTQFENAQRLQTTARNLILRIAQAGQADAALSQLLVRHDFKVNLNANTNTNAPAATAP